MPFTRLRQSLIKPNGSITGSLSGTSSYARRTLTASYALNSSGGGGGGGSVQTGSIANQTLWTNVTSGSTNTITGLSLSSNKWNVNVVEEWDAATLDQYYNSCSLLCHFDTINPAGRFIDNSRNNLAITSSGDTKLSTSQYKFGGASVYFDGTNDYLNPQNNALFAFGTGNFTVEFWMNSVSFANVANTIIIFDCRPVSTDGLYPCIYFFSGQIRYYVNSADRITGTTLNTGQWYHVALTRFGSSTKLFVDGTQVGSTYTDTNNYLCGDNRPVIATRGYTLGENNYNGYVDELRITKGVARYTANFTPQTVAFPNSRNQVLTRYVGLVGGIDDKYVDYGVQKLSNSSLKLTRLTYPNQPIVGSGSLSGSVSRVYVNVLDYDNVSISGSISNAVTASYALNSATSSFSRRALSASYLIPTSNNTTKAIFGYGYNGSVGVSMTNLVSNIGIVANDTTGVGTARSNLAAAGYGTDKAIFGFGTTGANVSMTNLVSNTGVVATDTTGVGTERESLAAVGYGSDKAIFGYGYTTAAVSLSNLVSNTGVVATDTTGVGTARRLLAATGYGGDKAIFGYGFTTGNASMTNLVSNTGIVATDTTGVGTARYSLAAAAYGTDKAIFGYGTTGARVSMTNLVSNTGVVANDTTGVGTARDRLSAAGYSTT